jgi:hypothetical protein
MIGKRVTFNYHYTIDSIQNRVKLQGLILDKVMVRKDGISKPLSVTAYIIDVDKNEYVTNKLAIVEPMDIIDYEGGTV